MVVTKGQNPALMGAGRSESEAIVSLGEQVALAMEKMTLGDAVWAWLQPYLPS